MKYLLVLFFTLSFVNSSQALSCGFEESSVHCLNKLNNQVVTDMDNCHRSQEEDDKSSSEGCNCPCHGHHCQSFSIKRVSHLKIIESHVNSVIFPTLVFQMVEGYYSRINRPPIS